MAADPDAARQFVVDWVAIEASWGLSVHKVERDTITASLESCPERTVTVTPRVPGELGEAS